MVKIDFKNKKTLVPLIIICVVLLLYLTIAIWQYFYKSNEFSSGSDIMGYSISNQSPSEVTKSLENTLSNNMVTIETEEVVIEQSAKAIGVYTNQEKLEASLKNQRIKRALLPFIFDKNIESPLAINETHFNLITQNNIPQESLPPKYSKYEYKDNEIIITDSQPGNSIKLSDINDDLLENALSNENLLLKTSLQIVDPAVTKNTMQNLKDNANNIASNKYELVYENKVYDIKNELLIPSLTPSDTLDKLVISQASAKDINEQVASQANIQAVDEVTTIYKSGKPKAITTDGDNGRIVNNIDELTDQFVESIINNKSFSGKLTFKEVVFKKKEITVDDTLKTATYTYKIITWGKTESSLEDFANKVAQTLADGRGWAQAGVTFKRVTGASDFDVVLSEPSELPARYPGTCDSTYSCRVGRYVIINDDRWRLATPSWNNANGTLRDYQHMVVNHETGHRLGRGHEFCASPGNAAPIMQQQSISLQGCTFNPWPLSYEIAAVQRSL